MNATTQKETLDLGAMMEETLDSIPEAADFTNPPPGLYLLSVKDAKVDKYTTKKEPDTEKQRMKMLYSIVSTVQVAGNEPPVPDGSMFSETFQATVDGLSYFKKRIKEIMNVSDMSGVTLSQMMDSVKGMEFQARITIRKSKGDDGTEYENLQIRVVAPQATA